MTIVEWPLDLPSLVREVNKTLKPTKPANEPLSMEIVDAKKNSIVLMAVDHRLSKRCWYDHHQLSMDPAQVVHCPLSFTEPDVYHCTGTFCSFECALGYANAHHRDPHFRDSTNLLYQLFTQSYPDLDPPSPREIDVKYFESYGGHLNIDTFRQGGHPITQTPNWVPISSLGRVESV